MYKIGEFLKLPFLTIPAFRHYAENGDHIAGDCPELCLVGPGNTTDPDK